MTAENRKRKHKINVRKKDEDKKKKKKKKKKKRTQTGVSIQNLISQTTTMYEAKTLNVLRRLHIKDISLLSTYLRNNREIIKVSLQMLVWKFSEGNNTSSSLLKVKETNESHKKYKIYVKRKILVILKKCLQGTFFNINSATNLL